MRERTVIRHLPHWFTAGPQPGAGFRVASWGGLAGFCTRGEAAAVEEVEGPCDGCVGADDAHVYFCGAPGCVGDYCVCGWGLLGGKGLRSGP